MNKAKEEKVLNQYFKKLQQGLKSFAKNGNPEHLHRLRVEIKKLKALLSMIDNIIHSSHLLKKIKPVQKVFKLAGNVRDTQIHLQLADKYGVTDSDFVKAEENKASIFSALLKVKTPKYLKKIKNVRRQLKRRLRKIPDRQIVKYYKQELKVLAERLNAPLFDESLHDSRKQLKELMYNQDIAGGALHNKVEFNIDYVDELQHNIGVWHDYTLAIELFDTPQLHNENIIKLLDKDSRTIERQITTDSKLFKSRINKPANHKSENK